MLIFQRVFILTIREYNRQYEGIYIANRVVVLQTKNLEDAIVVSP